MRFMLKRRVFDAPSILANLTKKLNHVDMDTVNMVLEEMAKLSKNVLFASSTARAMRKVRNI